MENIEYLQTLPVPALGAVVLLLLGKALKDLTPLNNKWIPLALGFAGGVGYYFIQPTIQSVMLGVICGFGSTGIHQAVTQLSPAKTDTNTPTPPPTVTP